MTEFKRVFIDTAPLIYFLENNALYMESIKNFLQSALRKIFRLLPLPLLLKNILCFHIVAVKWNLRIISKDL